MKFYIISAVILLCAALALSLCACGGNEDASTGHRHEYESEITVEPRCEETGIVKYTCSCGVSYEEAVEALGHDFVADEVVQPTIFTDGYTVYKCSRCGATENRDPTKYSGGAIELPDIPLN